ncbi:MAG: cupin domain-containing protein [Gammaproteobacteria bacterium]|nr:cupin domain-containing protein [Gammaproteobacteria bacterium]MDH5593371.1 cupin domain-containing protein [Gammaproteobacteria bacterium]MDH5613464.1 cupin domain-containing protein [Gammaproteobacteria bacterium]
MKPGIKKASLVTEFSTAERCFISEIANDADDNEVSIARARVEPGVTTAWHKLNGITERYLIIEGEGHVEIEGLEPANVSVGDVVRIPAEHAQRITNTGKTDLVFYCICSPPFRQDCYESLE